MTLTFHEPKFLGLYKVISGGQCGADRGALEAAYDAGVLTGGWAPKGFLTAYGYDPILGSKFGLCEDTSSSYVRRTKFNVEEAGGTVIIASNLSSPGARLTLNHLRKCDKLSHVILLHEDYEDAWLQERALVLSTWVVENRILVLNVAGNRDKTGSTFHHQAASKVVTWLLADLYNQRLLAQKAIQ